jgi:hypothetical protein
MATLQDRVTAASSIALRIASYIFLRWIPGHVSRLTPPTRRITS